MAGIAVEGCASELKGAATVPSGSSAAVFIASLGLGTGNRLVTGMASDDAGGGCCDSARYDTSPFTRWLGAWVKSWVSCLARSSWGSV